MIKKTLEMDFIDGMNKIFKISIQDPREDLVDSDISEAMDIILGENIFDSNNSDLIGKRTARYIETTTQAVEL